MIKLIHTIFAAFAQSISFSFSSRVCFHYCVLAAAICNISFYTLTKREIPVLSVANILTHKHGHKIVFLFLSFVNCSLKWVHLCARVLLFRCEQCHFAKQIIYFNSSSPFVFKFSSFFAHLSHSLTQWCHTYIILIEREKTLAHMYTKARTGSYTVQFIYVWGSLVFVLALVLSLIYCSIERVRVHIHSDSHIAFFTPPQNQCELNFVSHFFLCSLTIHPFADVIVIECFSLSFSFFVSLWALKAAKMFCVHVNLIIMWCTADCFVSFRLHRAENLFNLLA